MYCYATHRTIMITLSLSLSFIIVSHKLAVNEAQSRFIGRPGRRPSLIPLAPFLSASSRIRLSPSGATPAVPAAMKRMNPKYAWREWLIAPAYKKAEEGDYSLIKELQAVLSNPYEEQSSEIEAKYDRLRPEEFFSVGASPTTAVHPERKN